MNTLQARDEYVTRDRKGRAAFFFSATGIILVLPTIIFSLIGLKMSWPQLGWLLGLPAGVGLWFYLVPEMHFRVSGNKYLLATGGNGENIPFGPGFFRFRYPWDKPREDGNYSADVIDIDAKETVACSDGISVDVVMQIGYQIAPSYLDTYDAINRTSIGPFINAKVRAWLSQHLVQMTSDTARTNISNVETEARRHLQGTLLDELAKKFGIRVPVVNIQSIDLTPQVQKARDAGAETRALLDAVGRALVGDQEENGLFGFALASQRLAEGKITQAAFNAALNTARGQGGDIKYTVQDFNINGLGDLSPEAAAAAAAAFKATLGKNK